jgi:hypothetical protein
MSNKILKITKKLPQITTLPNGSYAGTWSGNIIKIQFQQTLFELTTEEGVRGINIKVIVTVLDDVATFTTIKN